MNGYTFADADASPLAHDRSKPASGEVHVWYWTTDSVGDDSGSSLDAEERDRCDRLVTTELRRRFLASHAGLRQILAGYFRCIASDLAFEHTSAGKPYLADAPLLFNLSHSADANLLAVATVEVGVDIERTRSLASLDSLAARHFSGPELEAMRTSDEPVQTFFQTWTRKEAVIKLAGLGLAAGLLELDTSVPGESIAVPASWKFRKNCCWLTDFATDLNYVSTVAIGDKPHTVRMFRVSE